MDTTTVYLDKNIFDGILFDMDIGKNIRRARKQADLTQDELSQRAGISRGYLAKVERNVYIPSGIWLQDVARALNIPVETLTGEAPAPVSAPLPAPAPPAGDTDTDRLYARLIRFALNLNAAQLQAVLHYAQYVAEHPPEGAHSKVSTIKEGTND